MESYQIETLSFTYPNRANRAVDQVSLRIGQGEFVTVCGKSGCGKTTLLRLLKPSLAPFGESSGTIYFEGKPLSELSVREQAAKIGFVMQSPDNQIVTDKVWHELAFGLESLGCPTPEIRIRVAEMASFFGIQTWFHQKTTELSGGQKQLLNLAAVMVMQPSVLILDEPTSQLDPIGAGEFIKALEKINRELGTTIIITEHRLEEVFAVSDRIVVMDQGKIIADDRPQNMSRALKGHEMYDALPAPMRIFGAVENGWEGPVTVREGREWLAQYSKTHPLKADLIPKAEESRQPAERVIEVKDAWFRYEKELPDVVKGFSVQIGKGELFAIVGGNGTGKTTALSLISGLNRPYRGEVLIKGQKISQITHFYGSLLGVLPQNHQTLFVKKTVCLDLLEILSGKKLPREEQESRIKSIAALCRIEDLLECHPYDLSGGEQQRAALAKVLLQDCEILLLDEPTKGMDAHFKQIFGEILKELKAKGVTLVMVSHDIEFCAAYADRCGLFFDGTLTSVGTPKAFFSGKSFYTTSTNRMARISLPEAVLSEDVILACGGTPPKKKTEKPSQISALESRAEPERELPSKRPAVKRIALGSIFALLFVVTCMLQKMKAWSSWSVQLITILELGACLLCFLPKKKLDIKDIKPPKVGREPARRTLATALFILIAVPLTILIGMIYLQDRKYYFISLLIILETIVPFCAMFENRKPQARELVVISVLCAIAVAGRRAFYMLPQFKPVAALVILTGICFGGEAGFLVGAVSAFVSNFLFAQGPWTPWQMFAFGLIGLTAGVLFRKGLIRKTRVSLCIFGFFATLVLYGGIMNPASVMMWQEKPTAEMFLSAYAMGFPFDLVHAASTTFFLWFLSEPMIEKLERIKEKYGLVER